MNYKDLPSILRKYRKENGFSMMRIAERMRPEVKRSLSSLVSGPIMYFEKGWAELGYALNESEP